MRAGKGQVEVVCGPKEGLFDLTQRAIRCSCEECRAASAGWLSLGEYERHGGKASNRKPKASIRIKASGQQLGKWMEEHGEARPSQRSRGSQPGSGGPTAAAGSDTEGSDRLGVLLEAARQRQLLGTPTEAEHGLEEGPRRSSSGASSSQAGLEGLAGGAGGSPPPSQGQVAAALAAAGAAARQVSSSREESSSEESSSADSGDSSSRDSSSGSEEDEQAAEASPAAPVVPAPGRRRAAAAAAAEAGSPGSTEGEGARRVVPRRAAAPRAGFGTQLHIHPPPASNKQVAAQQEQERGGKPPAKRNKRQQQQDVEAEQDEEALPAKRPRGRPPRAQQQAQQAQQGEEPPAKRPAGRPPRAQQAQQPAPQQAPQPAAQAPQLRCSSLKILKDATGQPRGVELFLVVPKGAAPGSGGGGDGSVALLERVAGAADELRLSLESFSVGEPSKHGTPLELQLWLLAGPRAASAGPAARGPLLGAAAVVLQVAIDLIKRLG